jgi:serine/threonine protein kinase
MPTRIARFRIDEELARDHEGTLYAAYDETARRKVELRVLPPSPASDPARRARIVEDARAVSMITHPNLATVLDVIEDPLAIVYPETAPGTTLLRERMAQGPIDLAEALRIAQEITSATGALHRAGVGHRAIDEGHVVLHDDGRSRLIGSGLAELHPDGDPRTDVGAIARLLHAMLGGKQARDGERLGLLDEHRVPSRLVALLDRASDPDRARRPTDADALLEALTAIDLPAEPVGASASATREAVSAGASRLWVVGASLVLAVVIVLAIAVVLTQAS